MPVTCPCCGLIALDECGNYNICPRCMWEDDGFSRDNIDLHSECNRKTLRCGMAEWHYNKDQMSKNSMEYDRDTPEDREMLQEIQKSIKITDEYMAERLPEIIDLIRDHVTTIDVSMMPLLRKAEHDKEISDSVDAIEDRLHELNWLTEHLNVLNYCNEMLKK
jgi:hypothetical protein